MGFWMPQAFVWLVVAGWATGLIVAGVRIVRRSRELRSADHATFLELARRLSRAPTVDETARFFRTRLALGGLFAASILAVIPGVAVVVSSLGDTPGLYVLSIYAAVLVVAAADTFFGVCVWLESGGVLKRLRRS